MTNFLLFLLLIAALAVNLQLKRILNIMPNLQERLDNINTALNEAADEIIAELQRLREGNLTPEQEQSLANIESRAEALRNVSPPLP